MSLLTDIAISTVIQSVANAGGNAVICHPATTPTVEQALSSKDLLGVVLIWESAACPEDRIFAIKEITPDMVEAFRVGERKSHT